MTQEELETLVATVRQEAELLRKEVAEAKRDLWARLDRHDTERRLSAIEQALVRLVGLL